MGTVIIGADTFDVIGTSAGLVTYANGSLTWSAVYDAAVAASASKPKRAHVEATRLLGVQPWDGDATTAGIAWPRDGVTATTPSGAEVVDGVTPTEIEHAVYELALAMMADASVVAGTSTAKNIASVGAGSASVTFFGPTAGGRFPDRVMELIGWAFASASSGDLSSSGLAGSAAYGADYCSQFDACDDYGRTEP